jgi:hypothetical protein
MISDAVSVVDLGVLVTGETLNQTGRRQQLNNLFEEAVF